MVKEFKNYEYFLKEKGVSIIELLKKHPITLDFLNNGYYPKCNVYEPIFSSEMVNNCLENYYVTEKSRTTVNLFNNIFNALKEEGKDLQKVYTKKGKEIKMRMFLDGDL